MTASRPLYQLEWALPIPDGGEASRGDVREVEVVTAIAEPEASTEHLMEAICAPDNIKAALESLVRSPLLSNLVLGGDGQQVPRAAIGGLTRCCAAIGGGIV